MLDTVERWDVNEEIIPTNDLEELQALVLAAHSTMDEHAFNGWMCEHVFPLPGLVILNFLDLMSPDTIASLVPAICDLAAAMLPQLAVESDLLLVYRGIYWLLARNYVLTPNLSIWSLMTPPAFPSVFLLEGMIWDLVLEYNPKIREWVDSELMEFVGRLGADGPLPAEQQRMLTAVFRFASREAQERCLAGGGLWPIITEVMLLGPFLAEPYVRAILFIDELLCFELWGIADKLGCESCDLVCRAVVSCVDQKRVSPQLAARRVLDVVRFRGADLSASMKLTIDRVCLGIVGPVIAGLAAVGGSRNDLIRAVGQLFGIRTDQAARIGSAGDVGPCGE